MIPIVISAQTGMDSNTTSIGYGLLLVGGTLLGATIPAVFAFINNLSSRRAEQRKHTRELVVKAAIEAYLAQIKTYEIHKQPTKFVPLEVYLISMVKFSELFLEGRSLDTETIEQKYFEVREASRAALKGAAAGASVEKE